MDTSEEERRVLSENLYNFTQNRSFTDVVLVDSEKREHFAHKVILAAGSEYFRTLFGSSFRESSENRLTFEISSQELDLVLQAIYGQLSFSGNFQEDLRIVDWLNYFQVYGYDVTQFLSESNITPDDFDSYVEFIHQFYEEIPQEIIDKTAQLITPETDFSYFTDQDIYRLLSSEQYQPQNVDDTYNIIQKLTVSGRSSDLIRVLNFKLFPYKYRDLLGENVIEKYSSGPIPRLTSLNWNILGLTLMGVPTDVYVLVLNQPQIYFNNTGFVHLIDSKGKIWYAIYSYQRYPNLREGDILKTSLHITDRDNFTRLGIQIPEDTDNLLLIQ